MAEILIPKGLGADKLQEVFDAQVRQLEGAYREQDPVSWRRHPLSPLTSRFLSHVGENADLNGSAPIIADLGCGAGEKTSMLNHLVPNIVGVDMLNEPLIEARKISAKELDSQSVPTKLVQGDLRDLPFASKVFNGAHDYLAFLHVIREEWPKYIDEVHRILKKGAPLIIVTFSGNDPDFYGYPVNTMEDRGIVFSDRHYKGDPKNVAHLINSYFYLPKKDEIVNAFGGNFDIVHMKEIPHPLHQQSPDHRDRNLWHILLRNK